MIEHCVYGVTVFCDLPLFEQGLPRATVAPGQPEPVYVSRSPLECDTSGLERTYPLASTHGRRLALHTDRELARSVAGQQWCMEVKDIVSFRWVSGESEINYVLHLQGTPALLAFWLVHIFLPLQLTLERGYDFIHAAAVEASGGPILFIAPSHGGKSTMGAYFLKRGHPMLSDDKVAMFVDQNRYFASPSHPHHRPYRQFEVLGDPVEPFATRSQPIHAFYVLERGEPDATVEISEVTGFRKFQKLLPNYLYGFGFLHEQRLRWLADLANQSLIYRVIRPWNLDRMGEVYDTICAHSQGLK